MSYMTELSERAYSAGWMQGLEYALWQAVTSGPRTYGRSFIGEVEIERLKELSRRCGGWIYFDDQTEETWIAEKDWEKMFESSKSRYPLD